MTAIAQSAAGTPDPAVVLAAVALPFVAAALVVPAFRLLGERTAYLGTVVAAACFALLATQYGTEGTVTYQWIPALGIDLQFHVDAWALLFALLASGIGVLIFTYSASYMHGESSLMRYYASLMAFMGSIVGIALSSDLVVLFLFWEATSVCSFLLIGHHSTARDSQYAARMAMFVTVGGGLFLLAGILLLRVASGVAFDAATFDLARMLAESDATAEALRETGLFVPVLLLFAVGAGAKSAQVPLHFWLPNAMKAPTPVSAFLHSATMVKVGVYFLGRVRPILASPEWTLLFVSVGLATMTVTAVLAVAATDVKELLAYSTASHLGLMVAGFGFVSSIGASAGVFHLLNHATFKAALFLVAGIVAHEAGTRHLDDLGGLRRDLPLTAGIAGIAGLGMAGVPPFNGFYSKELLFEAAYHAGEAAGGARWLFPAVAVFASIFTVLYSLRFLAAFFGDRPSELGEVHRPPVTMLAPPAVLAVVAAVVAIDPHVAFDVIVEDATAATGGDPEALHTGLPDHLTPAVVMSAVTLVVGGALYPFYDRIHDGIRSGVQAVPPARANWWYDRLLGGMERVGGGVAHRVHNGLLRTYTTWILATTSVLALAGYAATGVATPSVEVPGVSVAVVLVLLVAAAAAVAVATAPSHVTGVLYLSLFGLMLAIFYILASAPDLALTQLVVETLALVLFLLVIDRLPPFYGEEKRVQLVRDGGLSLVVGATVFATVLFAAGNRATGEPSLPRYFTEQAVPGGGGTNVVNVVLVDFRIFDTLGEITVIAIAAISVLTLVIMRYRSDSQ